VVFICQMASNLGHGRNVHRRPTPCDLQRRGLHLSDHLADGKESGSRSTCPEAARLWGISADDCTFLDPKTSWPVATENYQSSRWISQADTSLYQLAT
jgi:hypothetical protein